MLKSELIWQSLVPTEAELPQTAAELAKVLAGLGSGYVLALAGSMGAGKTTLVRALLKSLGLSPAVPVTSPTYTLMNEYEIGDATYAHLDLYRAGPDFSLVELGVLDARSYTGIFVEWAEAPTTAEQLECSHRLSIETLQNDARRLSLYKLAW